MKPLPPEFFAACARQSVPPTPWVLAVSVAAQTLSLHQARPGPAAADFAWVRDLVCSTSKFGTGQQEGSQRTPLGLHRIAEKIGADAPAGTVFKGRQVAGHTSEPGHADAAITTRILWLDGLEPGFNRGGSVDSHARYIYIHGTADQAALGRPTSHGCVHLADADLIAVFDLAPSGTLVWIQAE